MKKRGGGLAEKLRGLRIETAIELLAKLGAERIAAGVDCGAHVEHWLLPKSSQVVEIVRGDAQAVAR